MNALVIADLHLSSSELEGYRWDVFNWLHTTIKRNRIVNLIILGDLTERKDNHPSELVNRVIDQLTKIVSLGVSVHVLMGNHDYLKPDEPYFRFLNKLNYCWFHKEPHFVKIQGTNCLFLPHNKKGYTDIHFGNADYIFAHQLFDGAKLPNGSRVNGLSTYEFEGYRVLSGDIHKYQTLGNITYIGPPHPVHFGEKTRGNALWIKDKNKETKLVVGSIRKKVINLTDLTQLNDSLESGDHVKVRLKLKDPTKWNSVKESIVTACKDKGLVLRGIELQPTERTKKKRVPSKKTLLKNYKDVFFEYCKQSRVASSIEEIGEKLLKDR